MTAAEKEAAITANALTAQLGAVIELVLDRLQGCDGVSVVADALHGCLHLVGAISDALDQLDA